MYKRSLILWIVIAVGCTQNNIPKDKAYPAFSLPARGYTKYVSDCPYEFEYPSYATIVAKDSMNNQRLVNEKCWINMELRPLNATLHISYKAVPHPDTLTKLMEDAYKLTTKHTQKADFIKDSIIDEPHLKGIWYDVGGNAASSIQFFLTDEKQHYLRGSLYFGVAPNIDSMQPIIDFVRKDIKHIVHTFHWK
jgi:gliding motility-associated lipoprotein GldD